MTETTTTADVGAVVDRLTAGEAAWGATDLPERIQLLGELHELVGCQRR